ncbi:putative dual 3',5'-cyclic-AMP and -GMP phosphodiesterase 11, partial [Apostichopus japonicus]
ISSPKFLSWRILTLKTRLRTMETVLAAGFPFTLVSQGMWPPQERNSISPTATRIQGLTR